MDKQTHTYKHNIRYLYTVLVLALAATCLVGCQSVSDKKAKETATKEAPALTVACPATAKARNPFCYDSEKDSALLDLTFLRLDDEGVAAVEGSYDKQKKQSTYHITLSDTLTCSDGTPLTADDVIFTWYVLCDKNYDGGSHFANLPIVGLDAYRYGTTQLSKFQKEVKQELKKPSQKSLKLFETKIIIPELKKQYKWVESLYEDDTYQDYTKDYANPSAFFVHYFNLTDGYTISAGAKKNDIIRDIAEQYQGDYEKLAEICGTDFKDEAYAIACDVVLQAQKKNKVSSISGIKKTGEKSVSITMKGQSDKLQQRMLEVYIAPLSLYGDSKGFDYDKNKFGFTKNDVDGILQKENLSNAGGPYTLEAEEEGSFSLTANPNYDRENPVTEQLSLLALDLSDMVQLVSSGGADISLCPFSPDVYMQFKNAAGKIPVSLHNIPTQGYVYLGINAPSLCADASSESEASIALRKGFLTLFSAYTADSVSNFYEDYVSVLPKKLTEEEAMNQAADYFKEAGLIYQEETGQFLASDGTPIHYTVCVVGFGEKKHPCFSMLTQASDALKKWGITLEVIDCKSSPTLWNAVADGQCQMWIFNYDNKAEGLSHNSYQLSDANKNKTEEMAVELALFHKQTALICSENVLLPESLSDKQISQSISPWKEIAKASYIGNPS